MEGALTWSILTNLTTCVGGGIRDSRYRATTIRPPATAAWISMAMVADQMNVRRKRLRSG